MQGKNGIFEVAKENLGLFQRRNHAQQIAASHDVDSHTNHSPLPSSKACQNHSKKCSQSSSSTCGNNEQESSTRFFHLGERQKTAFLLDAFYVFLNEDRV